MPPPTVAAAPATLPDAESATLLLRAHPDDEYDYPSDADTDLENANEDDDDADDAEADIEDVEPNPFIFLLTALTSFSGFLFGYDTGYISGALVAVGMDLGRILSPSDKEIITSATSFGALLGGLVAGVLADVVGRKWVTLGANVVFIIGALTQCFAHSVTVMVRGRLIMGLGVGVASLVAPLYISEMAPGRLRGRLVIVNIIAVTGGQVVAYIVGAVLETHTSGWRLLVALGTLPAFVQLVVFVFMPETPRFLARAGRLREAAGVIRAIYAPPRRKGPQSPEAEAQHERLIHRKVKLLKHFNSDQHSEGASVLARVAVELRQIVSVPAYRRSLIIACGLQGIQQVCGFNAMMYFSATIFEMAGFERPAVVSLGIAGTNLAFTFVAFGLIDRLGRRNTLLYTMWAMGVALIATAIALTKVLTPEDGTDRSGAAQFVVLAMVVYVAFYATGLGPVPWQQSELFPMSVRGVGTSLATATNWALNLVVSSTFLTMMEYLPGGSAFAVYAAMCFIGETLVYFMYPETSYLTLEQVQGLFEDGFGVEKSIALSAAARRRYEQMQEGAVERETSRAE
ncbi:general substrate transporter [Limtongia smithiae]|uniref:general substrate transporter n=1 Tax=Limtongia smithiae TaxID=1125753 RepID=UPI0034CF35C7